MPALRARALKNETVLAAILAMLLAACGETTGPPDPDEVTPTSVTVTAPATEVEEGAVIQLTATVGPFGASQEVTWSTDDATVATVDASGLVTPLSTGEVTVTATSTVDTSQSGSIELTITCRNLIQSMVADGGTVRGDVCHQALTPLTVNDGTLVIEEGAHISFGAAASLTVASAGRLNAVGTVDAKITLTSLDPAQLWRGVRFQSSASLDNRFEHVTLENGGSDGWSGAVYSTTALYLEGNTRLDVVSSEIQGSGGSGLTAHEDVELTVGSSTFAGNDIPAWVHPDVAQGFGSDNVFDANDEQLVRVGFGNNDAVSSPATWAWIGVPFEIQERMFVEAPLTLDPGATLLFEADVSMIVRNEGALTASGSAEAPVVFAGSEPLAGYWKGIQITTASAANVITNSLVEHGGSEAWTGDPDSRAMIYLEGNSKLEIDDSTLGESGHYALWVPSGGDISGFENNVLVDNARTIVVHPNRVSGIGDTNTFTGNSESFVRVSFGNNDTVTDQQAWLRLEVPYRVTVRTFVAAPLTIEAGTTVEFAQDASLIVSDDGSLTAIGTADAHIDFRGAQDLAAYWKGIEFGTVSAGNELDYVNIENAGSEAWFGGNDSVSSLYVTADGLLSLSNAVIRESGGYALILGDGGSVTCTNVDDRGFMYYDQATSSVSAICP